MTLLTKGMGAVASWFKPRGRKPSDLKKIHDKFFDKSGEMKQKGKDIVKEGLKGLKKQEDPWQKTKNLSTKE